MVPFAGSAPTASRLIQPVSLLPPAPHALGVARLSSARSSRPGGVMADHGNASISNTNMRASLCCGRLLVEYAAGTGCRRFVDIMKEVGRCLCYAHSAVGGKSREFLKS